MPGESMKSTYEARRELIFRLPLAVVASVVALIVIVDLIAAFPPLYFLLVFAWATYMHVPQFRAALYSALLFGTACLYSPFTWGYTHHPAPGLNFLLSLGFFGLVWISGIRTMQAWWQTSVWLSSPMLIGGAGLLATAFCFGSDSIALQNSSAHYQWSDHMRAILFSLGPLAGFGLLECLRTITKTGSCPDVDSEAVKDAGPHTP
jgi:hypothetical protein